MNKYYIITNHNRVVYLGEFKNFEKAWYYADYEANYNFVWLFREDKLEQLHDEIRDMIDFSKGL